MNYQDLIPLIAKPVQCWASLQINIWLQFIQMEKLIPYFTNLNGIQIRNLNSKKLSQMGINSNIMQKKLLNWIQNGLNSFNSILKDQFMYKQSLLLRNKQNISPNLQRVKTKRQEQRHSQMTILRNKNNNQKQKQYVIHNQDFQFQQNYAKLRITNYEGHQNAFYVIDKNGVKIGRAINNQIKSLQITVQNEHAQIICKHKQFYIIDLGTKSGTFIKINHKIQLTIGMLIQMGAFNLKVQSIDQYKKQVVLQCVNLQNGTYSNLYINLSNKSSYSFGRKSNNDFYKDDKHLSGTHAKIFDFKGKFILQDMSSTNGTWIRVSQINKKSQPYKLEDGCIVKIGNTITYLCKYQNENKKNKNLIEIQQNNFMCTMCNQNQRNILFLPCKHTISCQNCCYFSNTCPVCYYEIQQKIKMFI